MWGEFHAPSIFMLGRERESRREGSIARAHASCTVIAFLSFWPPTEKADLLMPREREICTSAPVVVMDFFCSTKWQNLPCPSLFIGASRRNCPACGESSSTRKSSGEFFIEPPMPADFERYGNMQGIGCGILKYNKQKCVLCSLLFVKSPKLRKR